jgi:hypothetical protein
MADARQSAYRAVIVAEFDKPQWPDHCEHGDKMFVGSVTIQLINTEDRDETPEEYDYDLHVYSRISGTAGLCIREGSDAGAYSSYTLLGFVGMPASCRGVIDEALIRFVREREHKLWKSVKFLLTQDDE